MFCILTNTYVVSCNVKDCELKEDCEQYNRGEKILKRILNL